MTLRPSVISRSSLRFMSKVLNAFSPDFSDLAPSEVIRRAERVEREWDFADCADTDVASPARFLNLRYGDGIFLCCRCSHENSLLHIQGPFPLRHLNCGQCDHILCGSCHSTEILTPASQADPSAASQRSDATDRLLRNCRVCPQCGLSHRTDARGDCALEICQCGCPVKLGSHYHIGSVEQWQRDPIASAQNLRDRRREELLDKAVKQHRRYGYIPS
ncbi:hypothetical protein BDU57DRAFT_3801 [Ampelomyces quisqualis]|uniref:Probable double zinc ribbon domain-containing protein n=1 Tax=Ampelomyces quisqualis TaxID=50730 RepID=A0A6A5QZ52_AMPQU|nr:hypothetical protein BDU57DRAFT_3801 [Ampelomyces quisqualis]